ncbi:hypothetical protein FD755_008921, partial [Muntiacus reevesi]
DSVRPWRLRGPCPLRGTVPKESLDAKESSKERTEKQKQKVHGIYKKQKNRKRLSWGKVGGACKRANDCQRPADPYLGGFSLTTPKRQKGIGEFFRLPPKDSEKQNRIPEERSACPLPPDHTDDEKEQNFLTHP